MRNIGVIYTGQLRTIKKTIHYLKKNVLLNDNVHVHACLENDLDDDEDFLKKEIGIHLKTLTWNDKNIDTEYFRKIIKDVHSLLAQLDITGRPIIEYYQTYTAYKKLLNYEKMNNFKYDYIIRTRPDIVICKPIDFHWLDWSDEEILLRKEKIREQYPDKNTNQCFMQTIIHDDLIKNISNIEQYHQIYHNTYYIYHNEMTYNITFDKVVINKDFLHNGNYIIALRGNLVYIINRKLFKYIANIYIDYGKYTITGPEQNWFWNAENQFCGACIQSNLLYCHYNTEYEALSVCEYTPLKYFNKNNEIKSDPPMLFFIMRF